MTKAKYPNSVAQLEKMG